MAGEFPSWNFSARFLRVVSRDDAVERCAGSACAVAVDAPLSLLFSCGASVAATRVAARFHRVPVSRAAWRDSRLLLTGHLGPDPDPDGCP